MAEIVFPCQCGLLLKVHDDDQVGQGIVCPSCGSTVIVPAAGIVVDEPEPFVPGGTTTAAGSAGKWLGLAYLGGVGVVTLGLIKFVLMPALSPPVTPTVVVAQADSAHKAVPDDKADDADPDEAPRRLLKRPAGGVRGTSGGSGSASPTDTVRLRLPASPGAKTGGPTGRGGARKRGVPAMPPEEAEPPEDSGAFPTGPPGRGSTAPRGGMMGGLGGMPGARPGGMMGGIGGMPGARPGGMGRGLGGMPTGPGGGLGRGRGGLPPPPPRGGFGTAGPAPDPEPDPDPDDRPASSPPGATPKTAGSDTGGPAKATRLPKLDIKPKSTRKPPAKKAVYAHIDNKEVREALENAAKNTTDILATFAAENFLRIAEKLNEGDPKATAEIKKLRRKIAEVRNEPPPP